MLGVFMVVVLISLVPGTSSPGHQHVTRYTGTDATLEFQVPDGTTAWWLKKPESDKYISYCQDSRATRPEDQEESFRGRVKGTDCDQISVTFSVTVSNLTPNDSGTYEFHWVESDGGRFNKTIFLKVTDPVSPVVYVSCVGIVVCIVIGFIYKVRCRKSQINPDEPESVELERMMVEEVVCPSEKKSPLTEDFSVGL